MMQTSILALLLMLSLSSAVIIESGDNGVQFANDTAALKCTEAGVQAVYSCIGNVVRVVSTVPGEGSTFYKPDGKVVVCPDVSPTEMGAECVQMMVPNYCPIQAECGASTAPEEFPGSNTSGSVNESGPQDTLPADSGIPVVEPEAKAPPKIGDSAGIRMPGYTGEGESLLGYLAGFIAALGIAAVGILFVLFRKSLAEDEA